MNSLRYIDIVNLFYYIKKKGRKRIYNDISYNGYHIRHGYKSWRIFDEKLGGFVWSEEPILSQKYKSYEIAAMYKGEEWTLSHGIEIQPQFQHLFDNANQYYKKTIKVIKQ